MKKIIAMFLTVAVAGVMLMGCAKAEEGDAAGTPKTGDKMGTDKKPEDKMATGKMDEKKPEDKMGEPGKMDEKKPEGGAPAPADKK